MYQWTNHMYIFMFLLSCILKLLLFVSFYPYNFMVELKDWKSPCSSKDLTFFFFVFKEKVLFCCFWTSILNLLSISSSSLLHGRLCLPLLRLFMAVFVFLGINVFVFVVFVFRVKFNINIADGPPLPLLFLAVFNIIIVFLIIEEMGKLVVYHTKCTLFKN